LGHLFGRMAMVDQIAVGAPGGENLDPLLSQAFSQLKKPGFVGNTDEGARDALGGGHGRSLLLDPVNLHFLTQGAAAQAEDLGGLGLIMLTML